MHTSVVKLRPETIVDLAKDVIRPAGWSCEWNIAALQKPVQCKIVLNSWNAYLQVWSVLSCIAIYLSDIRFDVWV